MLEVYRLPFVVYSLPFAVCCLPEVTFKELGNGGKIITFIFFSCFEVRISDWI